MSDYHEPYDLLSAEVRDIHRALISLKEEIEAVDWYSQRIAVCADAELKAVLTHARDEEIEHACIALEWIRRHMPTWDIQLRQRLFTQGTAYFAGEHEPAAEPKLRVGAAPPGAGLGIGKRLPTGG